MKHSSINGRIEFTSFDSFIEEELEKKEHFSHRLINLSDKPDLIWGLREWLIKRSGFFEVIGYVRKPDLNYWFEPETLIEIFDDLHLLFHEYITGEKGIDPESQYRLIRYMDNLNFILIEKQPGEVETPTSFDAIPVERFVSELWPEIQKEFVQFQLQLEKKYGHQLDVDTLFNQICWDGNNLLWNAMHLEIIEE